LAGHPQHLKAVPMSVYTIRGKCGRYCIVSDEKV
jgi:hypothetical protein